MMTRKVDSLSRRQFVIGAGAVGATGLAGCVRENPNSSSGSSGSSSGSSGSSGGEGTETSNDGQLSGPIDIAGSSTVFPLATAFSEMFREEHPGVEFSVQSTGSGGGFQNFFCVGETDFNNASRPISPEEETLCGNNGVEPVELQVATDALTVIVNNENDWAESLTVEQLRQIWSAENPPTTWSDINSDWPDEEIELFGPTDASGTYDYFIEAVIGEEGPGHRQDYSPTEQDRTIIRGVEGSKYAMGYMGFAYYSQNSDAVRAVAIDDGDGPVEPSLETAKSGEYTPLSRPLFTYPRVESLAEKQVAEFALYWMENTTNQEVVADEVGYVPLDEEQKEAQLQKLKSAIYEATSN